MADIELVVKIPEEVYKQFRKDQKEKYVSAMISTDIIANGTPLPKGHGELVDRDKFENLKLIHDAKYGHISWSDAIKKIKHSAPTIIEADKGEQV